MTVTQRVIRKSLAGEEDLLFGEGQVTQSRNGVDYTITKVRNIQPVNTLAERDALDTTKFKKCALYSSKAVRLYEHDGTSWVLVKPAEYPIIADALADTERVIGETFTVRNYSSTVASGKLYFEWVAAGTGTDDQGSYFDNDAADAQAKQDIHSSKITVDQYGVVANDSVDDTARFLSALESGLVVDLRNSQVLTDNVVLTQPVKLLGQGQIRTTTLSEPVIRIWDDGTNLSEDSLVQGLTFKQPNDPAMSGGTNNNHSCLKFSGAKNAVAKDLIFANPDLCLHFGYGNITLAERTSYYCGAENIYGYGVLGMGLEIFGSKHGTYRGCRFEGTDGASGRALFHGVRITSDDFAPNEGNYIEASVRGFANGASMQQNSRGNEVHIYADDCTNGMAVHGSTELVPLANLSTGNQIILKARNCTNGLFDGGSHNIFDLDIAGCTTYGVFQQGDGGTAGLSKGSTYRGTIRDTDNRLIELNGHHNNLDLVLIGKGAVDTSFGLLCAGDNNSGKLTVSECSTGARLNGDYNRLELNATNCTTALYIGGDNNTVYINTDGNVTLAGNNNTIIGFVGGTITNTGTNNDWKGINGYSYVRRYFSQATDASGFLTLTHNLNKSTIPIVSTIGDNKHAIVTAATNNDVTIRLYDAAGTVLGSASGLTIDLLIMPRISG